MGTFSVHIDVASLTKDQFVETDALVDTGATHTVFPGSMLKQLGVEPIDTLRFSLADERKVHYALGQARVRMGGKERIVLVVSGPDET
ncbi:MAG: aspartyl protease family protein, partial [Bacteroidota bacterium]